MRFLLLLSLFLPLISFAQSSEKELIAIEYMNTGEYEKAAQLYEEIYSKNKSTYIYDNYLECLIKTEKWKEAEKLSQRQAKNNPSIARFKVDEGYVLFLQNNQKSSDKIFNETINWAMGSIQYVLDLSASFQSRKLGNWAIKTLKAGKKQFENNGSIIQQLAVVYKEAGMYAEMTDEHFELIEKSSLGLAEVQKQLQDLLLEDIDGKYTEILKEKLLGKVQKNPADATYTRLLIWFYEQNKQFDVALMHSKAFDKRSKNDGDLTFELAQLAISNGFFDVAESALEYVISLGENKLLYAEAKDLLFEVEYLKLSSNPASTKKEYDDFAKKIKISLQENHSNKSLYSLLTRLAYIEAYFLSMPNEAIEHIDPIFSLSGLQNIDYANAKLLKGDIMLIKGDVWEASLLYSQVEKAYKNDTIGFYAKFRNARLYYFIGEFDYAEAQLEILRGATSKLIANDAMDLYLTIQENVDYDSSYVPLEKYAKADMLMFSLKYSEALAVLDTILNNFPSHPVLDDAIFKKAQIYLLLKQYDDAIANLNKIVEEYYFDILADNALFTLASIYENNLNNKELAMKNYLQLIEDFPGSILVNEARIRYRALRGDNLN